MSCRINSLFLLAMLLYLYFLLQLQKKQTTFSHIWLKFIKVMNYFRHKVKEPEPTIPIEAFSWQSMDFHLSLQYLRQRQQLLYNRNERQRRLMRDDISRSRRSSIRRSSSTERRRWVPGRWVWNLIGRNLLLLLTVCTVIKSCVHGLQL